MLQSGRRPAIIPGAGRPPRAGGTRTAVAGVIVAGLPLLLLAPHAFLIDPMLPALDADLCSNEDVAMVRANIGLFGSWARGEAGVDSDVDVLVDVDASIGLRLVDLGADLEHAMGRRVDLVSRRAIKPSLWALIHPS